MFETSYQHYLLGLIAVANNISALAPFIALTAGLDKTMIRRLVFISSFSSFIIMIISLFFGTLILKFFGISISAFQIAGGILLCGTGTSMLNAKSTKDVSGKQINDIQADYSKYVSAAIVPIALPLTAGAGSISTITLFSEMAHKSNTMPELFVAILTITIVIYICFYFANNLVKVLGDTGMSVLIKVMGLFTLAIGVQFIVTGVSTIYKGLIS